MGWATSSININYGPPQYNGVALIQKMGRSLKFRIYELEGLYYLCSENKGEDQLPGFRPADLRLCLHMLKAGFLMTWPRAGCTKLCQPNKTISPKASHIFPTTIIHRVLTQSLCRVIHYDSCY